MFLFFILIKIFVCFYQLIFQQNCNLFGGKPRIESEVAPLRDKPTSLLRENQKFANASFTLPASNSAVFHAGTIGRGLKPKALEPEILEVSKVYDIRDL